MTPTFDALMAKLLRHFNLAVPPGTAHEVYSLHFEGRPSIHLISRENGTFVDVLTEGGCLPNSATAEQLLSLLELNAGGEGEFPAAVTVHRATRIAVVWTRCPMRHLDLQVLKGLIDGVRRKAAAARQLLEAPASTAPPRSASTLAHMIRFKR